MLDAEKVFKSHVRWVNDHHQEWNENIDYVGDQFWQSERGGKVWATRRGGRTEAEAQGTKFQQHVQVNLGRPWLHSFLASLRYDQINVEITDDALPNKAEELTRAGVQNLVNRWLHGTDIEAVFERMYNMGLTFHGGCAARLKMRPMEARTKAETALDVVGVEALAPWECMWDRNMRSPADSRYWGLVYPMPIEQAVRRWPEHITEETRAYTILDVPKNGFKVTVAPDRSEQDESYVYIMEILDLTQDFEDGDEAAPGKYHWYLVEQPGMSSKLVELDMGPPPYTFPTERPARCYAPFIPEPVHHRAMDSWAPIRSLRNLNAELNRAITVVAEAFRRDAARVILYAKKAGISQKAINQILQGDDMALVGLDVPQIEGLFKALEMPPVSQTLLDYIRMTHDEIDRTQILGDFTRGQAGKYLSATEQASIVEYTATTIGRVRKHGDDTIEDLCELYLQHLRGVMEELGEASITVMVGDEEVKVSRADLAIPWRIQVVDSAVSPAENARRIADFIAALPHLEAAAAQMNPENPEGTLAAFKKVAYDFLVDGLGLPKAFASNLIISQAPAPPAPPEPAGPSLPDEQMAAQGEQPPLDPVSAAVVETAMAES